MKAIPLDAAEVTCFFEWELDKENGIRTEDFCLKCLYYVMCDCPHIESFESVEEYIEYMAD
jgi:hypothetical protein